MLLFRFVVFVIQMTFVNYFVMLTTLLGTIFICKCKTDDATRCKH